ncbi:MAG: FG-GAP repeat protein, partial [Deltaproteobacteria bacterium]|nr:FG-GAP repeat protein [Deltaproteobacteria bacterium]
TGNWSQTHKLMASDSQLSDNFGSKVSISGDNAIVGASYEDGGPGTLTCGVTTNAGTVCNAGAAYVFHRDSVTGDWSETSILHASDAQTDDRFGFSVAIGSDHAIVGTYLEDGGDGDPLFGTGAVYIFD